MSLAVEELNAKVYQGTSDAEEKVAYLTEKEQKTSEKMRKVTQESDLMRAEMKNMVLRLQVLERKAEEATTVENALVSLQRDYNELVREKAAIVQNYESKIFYLKDEGKEAKGAAATSHKTILRVQKEAEEWQREFHTLNREMTRLKKANDELFGEVGKRDRQLEDKSKKLEAYATEIGAVNAKITEFNSLMEKLIQENQRLNVMVGDSAKAAHLTPLERKVMERAKSGGLERDGILKMTSTLKNFRAEPAL